MGAVPVKNFTDDPAWRGDAAVWATVPVRVVDGATAVLVYCVAVPRVGELFAAGPGGGRMRRVAHVRHEIHEHGGRLIQGVTVVLEFPLPIADRLHPGSNFPRAPLELASARAVTL